MTRFAELAAVSARVGATASRSAKVRELASLLRSLAPGEIDIAAHYLSGELPQGRIGIGYSLLQAATDQAMGSWAGAEPDADPNARPGSTEAAETGTSTGARTLSIMDVDAALTALASLRGSGSTERRAEALHGLLSQTAADERDFLLHLLAGELRQGALAGMMVEAIAQASGLSVSEVRRAAMYAKDLGMVARAAMLEGGEGLGRFQLELFAPIAPMLAQTAADVGEALDGLGGEAAFEWKLDGARIQVHRRDDEVRIYTRTLNDVTAALPEIVETVQGLDARVLVLDGEAIAEDASGRPHPFQITMRRFGRKLDVATLRSELPIRAYFFDCLRLEDRSLVGRPTRERLEALCAAVPQARRVPRLVASSVPAARAFYDAALAAGHEGLMAKSLGAPYEAGNRGASWLKVKRAHTLDLVVIAVEWGHGRRSGKLSNLHLGARDPARGEYVMLGKTFKGLTDAMLEWQTRELLARETHRDQWTVYVRPELVVEIAFSDLQASSRYPGGLALRLARVKRYRDDKRPDEADTMETVRRIYAAQGGERMGSA